MKRIQFIKHKFVEAIPSVVEEGTLYISREYATAVHKCCCGCGAEVVTPLSPTDWQLTRDGKTVSLFPSVGNWSLACKSHYWIDHSSVRWAEQWSAERIEAGRRRDRMVKDRYYGGGEAAPPSEESPARSRSSLPKAQPGFFAWLRSFLFGK